MPNISDFKKCLSGVRWVLSLVNRVDFPPKVEESVRQYREYESKFPQTKLHDEIYNSLRTKPIVEKIQYIEDLEIEFKDYRLLLSEFESSNLNHFIVNVYLFECKTRIMQFYNFLNKIKSEYVKIKPNKASKRERNPNAFEGHYRKTETDLFFNLLYNIEKLGLHKRKIDLASVCLIFTEHKLITHCVAFSDALKMFADYFGIDKITYKPHELNDNALRLKSSNLFLDKPRL